MINKVVFVLKKNPFTRKLFQAIDRIKFTRAVSIPHIRPIQTKKSEYHFQRINLLIPSINKEHFFGGTSTAFKLFNEIVRKTARQSRARIIITDARPNKTAFAQFRGYQICPNGVDIDNEKQLLIFNGNAKQDIFVGENDLFIATAWWTAYSAQQIIAQQADLFDAAPKKLLYLIQDFEPGFYNWSSHYILAESTYRSTIPIIAVFNSSSLQGYFQMKSYPFFKEYVFEPRLNPALQTHDTQSDAVRKKTIIFYGRPSVDRNCFPLIIESLRRWVRLQPNLHQWKIISVGEKHPPVDLGNGQVIESVGKLSLTAYAKLLAESAIGISFMISPHPSYPPLEMAHCGLLTLTNSFATKDLAGFHENILSLERLIPEEVAGALLKLTERFTNDPFLGSKKKSLTPSYSMDSDQFPFIDDLINDFVRTPLQNTPM